MNIPITRSIGMALGNNDALTKIITQKYIASSLVPEEAWSDHRRLGLPFFENQAVEKDYNSIESSSFDGRYL